MKDIINLRIVVLLVAVNLTCIGCKKGFLAAKPSTDLVIPSSLKDLQQIIDYAIVNRVPALPLLSCDDYYVVSEEDWGSLFTATERHAYIWDKETFGGELKRPDWNLPFSSIFYANSVLYALESIPITATNATEYKYVKGQAFFARAFTFFELAKSFTPPFDPITADKDLGLPLKLSPNIDEIRPRSTLKETYSRIIDDLNQAKDLLPAALTSSRNRGNKIAVYALFARLYLSMRQYSEAEMYADSCLSLYNKLVDYNTISKTATTPFSNANDEVLFWSAQAAGYTISVYNARPNINIDTNLYNSYVVDDLRKSIFFTVNPTTKLVKMKRGYSTQVNPFAGLATDEIYLIKAECMARRQDTPGAIFYLNSLLINRFTTNKFVPYKAGNPNEALEKILLERRKELIWRASLRWDDLRRLNKDGANIILTRKLGSQVYTLLPNDSKYTFPIPDDEISLSGIQQNIR